jgi:transposase
VFGITGKKVAVWYRNVLSGFKKPETKEAIHLNDTVDRALVDRKTGKAQIVYVPILNSENFGEDMAIDDKNIDGEGYTILSNKKTGKIAMMASTTKHHILEEILSKVPISIRSQVKTLSRDLAESYDWVSRTMFFCAQSVADKFHIVKMALEALQDIRVRYRQEILTKERESKNSKKDQKNRKNEPQNKVFRYENGETVKEVLAKSRYLLFSFASTWRESQKSRAEVLFREFPEIKKAYDCISRFRVWYKKTHVDRDHAQKELQDWYVEVLQTRIPELLNLVSSLKRHEGVILNYFSTHQTNAFAESLNSRIAACIRMGYGIRDIDFFHFRIKKYFSDP